MERLFLITGIRNCFEIATCAPEVIEETCLVVGAFGPDQRHAGHRLRCRGVDANDVGTRMRRTQEIGMPQPINEDVTGIAPLAFQQARRLDLYDGLTDCISGLRRSPSVESREREPDYVS